jgi:hypothetical protein
MGLAQIAVSANMNCATIATDNWGQTTVNCQLNHKTWSVSYKY